MKFKNVLMFFASLLSVNSYGALSTSDFQQMVGENPAKNGSFQNGTAGWVASGGSLSTSSSSADLIPPYVLAGTWDSNSAAQTLTSAPLTIGGLAGMNGEMTCLTRVPSGTATHTVGVWDGSTLSQVQNLVSTSTYFPQTINFVFPSSGTVAIRFTSVASNEPSISLSSCYIGKARNIGQVAQAYLVDSVTVTGCTNPWQNTSTSLSTFPTQTSCVYTSVKGVCTAPATNIPAVKCSSLPPGDYSLEYEGTIGTATSAQNAFFQFSDGTNNARELSNVYTSSGGQVVVPGIKQSISYTVPQSNVTLEIKGEVSAGGTALIFGLTSNPGVFKIYYTPSSSQQVVTASAGPSYTDATTYTMNITGSTSNPTKASSVTLDKAQWWREQDKMRIRYTYAQSSGTGGAAGSGVYLFPLPSPYTIDTARANTTNFADGAYGTTLGSGHTENQTSGGTSAAGLASVVAYDSTHLALVALQNPVLTTQMVGSTHYSLNGEVYYSFDALVPITGWTVANAPAPIVSNSITTSGAGAWRTESLTMANACSTSPCPFSQNGSWVTNITRSATGTYSVNLIAGIFTAAPVCTMSTFANTTMAYQYTTASTSTIPFATANTSTTGLVDGTVSMMCIGPR